MAFSWINFRTLKTPSNHNEGLGEGGKGGGTGGGEEGGRGKGMGERMKSLTLRWGV